MDDTQVLGVNDKISLRILEMYLKLKKKTFKLFYISSKFDIKFL